MLMPFLRKSLTLSLGALLCGLFTACEIRTYYADDFENVDKNFGKKQSVNGSADTASRMFSLKGEFALFSVLEPENLEIVSVDQSLNGVDSVSAQIVRKKADITFSTSELQMPSSIVKLKFSCVFADSPQMDPMEFEEYVRVSENEPVKVKLLDALMTERIEGLVRKEDYSYAEAHDVAYLEVSHLLEWGDDNKYGLENEPLPKAELETPIYLYGRFFLQDSTFYQTLKKLSKSVKKNTTWRSVLPSVEIADELVRYYKMDQVGFDDSLYAVSQGGVNVSSSLREDVLLLVETVYGMPSCDSLGRMFTNETEKSDFAGTTFVCDRFNSNYVWRTANNLEETLGACVDGMNDSLYRDGRYACSGKDRNWLELGDWKTFVQYAEELFGDCDVGKEQLMMHADSLYARCENGVWKQIDKVMYYEGPCTLNRENVKVEIAEVGNFVCRNGSWEELK